MMDAATLITEPLLSFLILIFQNKAFHPGEVFPEWGSDDSVLFSKIVCFLINPQRVIYKEEQQKNG